MSLFSNILKINYNMHSIIMPRFTNSEALFLGSLLMCITASSSCLFNYVPDVEDFDDTVDFPWEGEGKKTSWNRQILNDCECGRVSENPANEKPWVALIRISHSREEENKDTFCSGSLINSKFILTAYSCFIKEKFLPFDTYTWGPAKDQLVQPADVTIWLSGTTTEFDPASSKDGLKVAEIIYDKNYILYFIMKSQTRNNAVLLRLEKELQLQDADSFVPVCLNPAFNISSDMDGRVYGWYPTKKTKSFLNSGTLIESLNDCREESSTTISDGHICIRPLTEGRIFDGYGAPIGLLSLSKQYILQVGIYSWSSQKRLIYTSIAMEMPFINYYSEMHSAKWCEEQKLSTFNSKDSKASGTLSDASHWPWIIPTNYTRKEMKDCTCGIHDAMQGRLIGGVDAQPHEFKWQVLLRIRQMDERQQTVHSTICGGTLINDRMILLAAHCVIQKALLKVIGTSLVSSKDVEVYVYVHKRKDDEEAQRLEVKRIHSHPGYETAQLSNPPYFDWDVALLELAKPVKFDQEKLIPICLPKSGQKLTVVGKNGLVTGWGLTKVNQDDTSALTLQKLDIPIQEIDYCRKVAYEKITDNFICAGTLDGNKDVAVGDSGGPLSIIGSNPNQHFQVGIVSWSEEVKGPSNQTASLYTDIQSVLPYIDYVSNEAGALWCSESAGEKTENTENVNNVEISTSTISTS